MVDEVEDAKKAADKIKEDEAKILNLAWRYKAMTMQALAKTEFSPPPGGHEFYGTKVKNKNGELVSANGLARSVQEFAASASPGIDLQLVATGLDVHFGAHFDKLMKGEGGRTNEEWKVTLNQAVEATQAAYAGAITTNPTLQEECNKKCEQLKKQIMDKANNDAFIAELDRCRTEMQLVQERNMRYVLEQGLLEFGAANSEKLFEKVGLVDDKEKENKNGAITKLEDGVYKDKNNPDGKQIIVSNGMARPADGGLTRKGWSETFDMVARQGDTLVLHAVDPETMRMMISVALEKKRFIEFSPESKLENFVKKSHALFGGYHFSEKEYAELKLKIDNHNQRLREGIERSVNQSKEEAEKVSGLQPNSQNAIGQLNEHWKVLHNIENNIGEKFGLDQKIEKLEAAVNELKLQAESLARMAEKMPEELMAEDFGYDIQRDKIDRLVTQIDSLTEKLREEVKQEKDKAPTIGVTEARKEKQEKAEKDFSARTTKLDKIETSRMDVMTGLMTEVEKKLNTSTPRTGMS